MNLLNRDNKVGQIWKKNKEGGVFVASRGIRLPESNSCFCHLVGFPPPACMVFIMAQCSRIGAHTGGCKSQVSWRWRCLRRLPSLPRSGSGFVRQDRRGTRCLSAVEAVSEAEDEANRKRWKESGGGSGDSNEW